MSESSGRLFDETIHAAFTAVVPAPVLVARPAGVIVATLVVDGSQGIQDVTSSVVTPLKLIRSGNIPNEVAVALVTFKSAIPALSAKTATMVAVPVASPFARPALIVATDGIEDVHKANCVKSWVLPSANVPIARKFTPVCWRMLAVGGEICIDVIGEESTVIVEFPLTEPN